MLILSIFPGIDLLGRGFEEEGFCVVRGPDLIWGGDIRRFHPPAGVFAGVIGGPPCQDFSRARTAPPTGEGLAMLAEYRRVVEEAQPDWWLLENVECTPDNPIPGYTFQRLDIWAHEFGLEQHRLRHLQFGCRHGNVLVIARGGRGGNHPTITANDTTTPWATFCQLQGLPPDFDIPAFTDGARRRAVGNGVPVPMARALARAIQDLQPPGVRVCGCGCGRRVTDRQTYARTACRVRAHRKRNASFQPGTVTASL
jgi:DNA (cytosine-5)-methyltransferase 1